jgi:hypothetical protein
VNFCPFVMVRLLPIFRSLPSKSAAPPALVSWLMRRPAAQVLS